MATQAQSPLDGIREIQKRVNLAAVRLIRSRSELHITPPVPTYDWEMDISARIGGRKSPAADGYIQIVAGLDVVARPSPGADKPKAPNAATISCDFGIDYKIEDREFYTKLRDADVIQFAARNGLHNAWPYMRAHIQATAASMLLPIVLPTYRPEVMFPDLTKAVESAVQVTVKAG